MKVLVTQLSPTLCDSMDCGPPDSFAHEVLQARLLEGDPTSLAPHERLTDLAVVPREKPHTVAGVAEQP